MNVDAALRTLRALPQGDIIVNAMSTLINAAIAEHAHDDRNPMAGPQTIYSTRYPFPVFGRGGEIASDPPLQPSGTYEDFVAQDGLAEDVENWTVAEFVRRFQLAIETQTGLRAEIERLGRLIAEWWSDPDNPPAGTVPIAQRWRPDLFLPDDNPVPVPDAPPTIAKRLGKDVPTYAEVCEMAAETLAAAGFPGYSPLSIVDGIEALALLRARLADQLATAQASARQHLEASSHRAQIAEHYREALLDLHRDVHTVVVGTQHGQALDTALRKAYTAATAPEWDKRIRP